MRAWLMASLLYCTACAHLTVERAQDSASPLKGAKRIELVSYLWGFLPTQLPPQNEICPRGKIEALDMKMETPDVWTAIVTLGIYVPHRVDIVCGDTLKSSQN